MGEKIIYPSIDLFLYDLKNGLGQDDEKINQNCEQFCKKIYGKLDDETFKDKCEKIKQYQNAEAKVLELLPARLEKFASSLDGYYYPLQLGDTYALQVDYSGKFQADGKTPDDDKKDIDTQPFKDLKAEIVERTSNQTGTIGQTWLLWGKLTNAQQDATRIAQECYMQLFDKSEQKWDRDFIGDGDLLGGKLFELWYHPNNSDLPWDKFWQEYTQESYHILIWLFPSYYSPDDMREAVKSVYYDFLRLFHYRHKIIWAYYQSRLQKSKLKTEFVELQQAINKLVQLPKQIETKRLKLNDLQKTLTANLNNLSEYTIELNYLDNQARTIKVNLDNYQDCLKLINNTYAGSNLKCLNQFSESDIYAQKYQRQVETDHANLSPGLTVLQNLTSTLQGIIDLERSKSDRKLDNTIVLASIGLALSGLTASVASAYQPQIKSYTDFSFLLLPAFIWSIAISAPFLIALIFRLFRR